MDFKSGDKIRIETGGEATVLNELGRGGQGVVYKVNLNGKEYAMKWYHKPSKLEFYKNLEKNVENGSPAPFFLWPLFLTEKDDDGCFGYLMNLRGSEYKEFSDFLLAKEQFKTVSAMVEAAIKIASAFRILHNKGYSYQDLNDGNFFINPDNGDVLVCDNDNVAPSDYNSGILGKCRYMAPEVISGNSMPNSQSDRFSLSVILFLLLFNNHPLEGEAVCKCPCMTEKHEKKFYGTNPVFIYDPKDNSNRPVMGIHTNVITLWKQFPEYVREAFTKEFSKESMSEPGRRITEKEWLDNVLLRLRHELVNCPACGGENFFSTEGDASFKCDECGKTISGSRPPIIETDKYKVMVWKGKNIHAYMTSSKAMLNTVTGNIVESKKNPGIFGLRNLTTDTWTVTTKSGNNRSIAPGEAAPLLVGNKLSFGNGHKANII